MWKQVVYDETGQVWVMLHSGSRFIGNSTAQFYDKKAVEYMKGSSDAKVTAKDINYLEIKSEAGQAYLQVRKQGTRLKSLQQTLLPSCLTKLDVGACRN